VRHAVVALAPPSSENSRRRRPIVSQLASNIVLDTSAVATDTIDYVATGPSSFTATSTRTILIEAPTPPTRPRLPRNHHPPRTRLLHHLQ
jgi:hypothetical protein